MLTAPAPPPAGRQVTCLASTTLSRCHFLCTVLSEEQEHHHLAFQIGLYGLEMCRPPASTKPLEVRARAVAVSGGLGGRGEGSAIDCQGPVEVLKYWREARGR